MHSLRGQDGEINMATKHQCWLHHDAPAKRRSHRKVVGVCVDPWAFVGAPRASVPRKSPSGVASRRLTYADAAKHLGVKPSTIRSMVHRRQVPHIRLGPQLVVFDTAALDAWIQECSVGATSLTPEQ